MKLRRIGEIVLIRFHLGGEIIENTDIVVGKARQVIVADVDCFFLETFSANHCLAGMVEHNLQ